MRHGGFWKGGGLRTLQKRRAVQMRRALHPDAHQRVIIRYGVISPGIVTFVCHSEGAQRPWESVPPGRRERIATSPAAPRKDKLRVVATFGRL